MDRLPLVAAVTLTVVAGCGARGGDRDEKPRSRVNAVEAKADEAPEDLAGFCEVYPKPEAAPKLTWPGLRTAAPAGTGSPRWINVWATWCEPCVEELPRLAKFRDSIGARVDYELVFLSGDGDPDAVAQFAGAHPPVKGSLEIDDAAALNPWLEEIGAKPPVLPVHVFVDGADRIRCIRVAGIGDADEAAVRQLLTSLQ